MKNELEREIFNIVRGSSVVSVSSSITLPDVAARDLHLKIFPEKLPSYWNE